MNSPGNHLGAQPDSEHKQLSPSQLSKSVILSMGFSLTADRDVHKVKVSASDKNNLVKKQIIFISDLCAYTVITAWQKYNSVHLYASPAVTESAVDWV